ncbi:flagella basal body P-ring formation protein FlgA [Ruegeria lacuscaerulensis ITI-1157]|nr:flagella basal body P-ring formation protein FlgA [Ruegeria lacuscaerulensis ITI-1157]SHJ33997.1 flagella basal body P-ring formation protein FlgA [Ruegeria lacuscaerulensis ITI-1157]
MRVLFLMVCLLCPLFAQANVVVPTRTIRAKEVITAEDLKIQPGDVAGAVEDPDLLVGQEARIALYPGRPIRASDVRAPAVVDRNDLVTLVFVKNGLTIEVEGRALGRGAVGERIRAMNLSSRSAVTGKVGPDGQIEVN